MRVPVVVAARDVRMTYQIGSTRVEALRGISLDVSAGEFLLLMGPSGSGKTTLLSILGGILTPTSGAVVACGTELTRLRRGALARFRLLNIGFVFQGFNLFSALTAAENVQLALGLKGDKVDARDKACELLEEVGLGEKCERLPADLSAGEKQRVAIARALAGQPRLIMADEPTASLDSDNGKHVTMMMRRLAKSHGCSVLTVTHDPRIMEVADRVLHIEDGALRG
ncbi:MAG: ABC transporter ATP-binding protein [Candidatus Eremiobacteraeota bacterium]|nr:ABC transporter ATP-binding protein [Candidatus Eremiobacteraeota bacterium]